MERDKMKTVAYHEAGHAIAARSLGVNVQYISIEPTDDMEGCVLYKFTAEQNAALGSGDPSFIKRLVIMNLSGMACDFKYWEISPGSKPDEFLEGHYSDQTQARLNLDKIGQNSEGDFNAYLAMAANLFGRPGVWPIVEALVSELIDCRTIAEEGVLSLLAHVPNMGDDYWELLEMARSADLRR